MIKHILPRRGKRNVKAQMAKDAEEAKEAERLSVI